MRTGIARIGLALVALAVAAGGLPGAAGATVGGHSYMQLLGFEPTDRKVYLLEHDESESGALPRLYFFDLSSAEPTRLIAVLSWYGQDAEATFDDRLAGLQARLQPLEPVDPVGFTLTQRITSNDACPDRTEMWGSHCLEVEFTARLGELSATRSVTSWGMGTAHSIFVVPGGGYLFQFRHTGHMHETGYDKDVPVLLWAATPR